MSRQYYFFKRPTKRVKSGKPVFMFYCQFVDENGNRGTAHSTGQTTKGAAEAWAQEQLAKGKPSRETLEGFATDFFNWESSKWIKRQHAYDRPFSRSVAQFRQGHLDNYILPHFGKQKLAKINRADVEDWLVGLKLSNQTKNHLMYTFRMVLREATLRGLIPSNPLERSERLGSDAKTRDVFTLEELRLLFPDKREELIAVWGDLPRATAMLLLASTGIRSGEVRALTWEKVLDGKALYIDQAVKNDQSIGPISVYKGGDRVVLLPEKARDGLEHWREKAPWSEPGDLVFASERRDRPQTREWLSGTFGAALKRAKVKTAGRVLVVHSFRHTFNTRMRKVLPADLLQAMTGHHSAEMTERYDHPTPSEMVDRLSPAKKLIESLFDVR